VQIIKLKRFGGAPHHIQFAPLTCTIPSVGRGGTTHTTLARGPPSQPLCAPEEGSKGAEELCGGRCTELHCREGGGEKRREVPVGRSTCALMDRLLAEAADKVVVNVDDEQDNDSTIAPLRHRVRWGRGSSSSICHREEATVAPARACPAQIEAHQSSRPRVGAARHREEAVSGALCSRRIGGGGCGSSTTAT
jgi:hypothetical protein